ncbi:HalOD1 output domain-containing protein [Haladaptatus caseinilyticus]|uniref:HalOD1 output domain-containing protein n=1 Tax=Haladaptatus caseinilyticus TaxID=2993314 RepID=UPI00224A9BFA|nr:HalOD1 output domain-containing protein [Haladaptatus caseinilyticus]
MEISPNSDGTRTIAEFDSRNEGGDALTVGIVDALSAATGVDPLEMEPLHYAVDVDAVATLIRSQATNGRRDDDITVSIRIDGCDVTIEGDGRIEVTEGGNDGDHQSDGNGP